MQINKGDKFTYTGWNRSAIIEILDEYQAEGEKYYAIQFLDGSVPPSVPFSIWSHVSFEASYRLGTLVPLIDDDEFIAERMDARIFHDPCTPVEYASSIAGLMLDALERGRNEQ